MSSNEFIVGAADQGQRLDQYLQGQLDDRSRAFIQKLIAEGFVRVNDRQPKPSYRVRGGDRLTVDIPAPQSATAEPENIGLEILYEDHDIVVINKSAGMVVHPAAGNASGTLVNALLHHCRGSLSGIGGVERPGIVHRLDKGTSGCIIVAKGDAAHHDLVAQFKSRNVKKIYRAICAGGSFEKRSGRIETVIGRSSSDRKKMSTRTSRGRAAVTDYKVLKQEKGFALVELHIHTGRTHQIRVHLAHIGHAVLGDPLYASRTQNQLAAAISIARPLLHAYILGVRHPRTGEPMEFTAPLPEDMKHYEWPD